MTGLATASARLAARIVAWVAFGIAGLLSVVMVGWVPPELAAMLGSRNATGASPTTPDALAATPRDGSATGTSTVRRGTPRHPHTDTDH